MVFCDELKNESAADPGACVATSRSRQSSDLTAQIAPGRARKWLAGISEILTLRVPLNMNWSISINRGETGIHLLFKIDQSRCSK